MNKETAKKNLSYSRMLWQNGGKALGITLVSILAFSLYMRFAVGPFIAGERVGNVRKEIMLAGRDFSKTLVEVTADFNSTVLNDYVLLGDPDGSYEFCRKLCSASPYITAASIKYRSRFFSGKPHYLPTVRKDSCFFSFDAGVEEDSDWDLDFRRGRSKFYVSDVCSPDFMNGETVLPVHLNVSDGKNGCFAIITAYVSQDMAASDENAINKFPGSRIYVVSSSGNITYSHEHSDIGKPAVELLQGLYGDALTELPERKDDGEEVRVSHDEDNVYFYQNIPIADRSIFYIIPADDLTDDIFSLTWKLILGLTITVFAISAASVKSIKTGMRRSIKDQVRDNEMKTAARIQRSMLPEGDVSEFRHADLATVLVPAEAVGGDLYYWLEHDGLFSFCVGDVSGKGVPAALFMARCISLFRNISLHESSPAAIAEMMNADLASNNDYNMFVTMFIGVYNMETNMLTCCNASHNAPILWSGDENDRAEFMESADNLPLGVGSGIPFSEKSVRMKGGEVIFIYTDGVTEALDEKNNCYGESGLLDCFEKHRNGTSEEINNAILEDVRKFAGKAVQSDDITMMTIGIHKGNNV